MSLLGLELGVPTALLTVIAFEAWRSFPFAFLFLTARLQAAPASLEEAARVDGATPTQRFRHIVLPQLLPTHRGAVGAAVHLDVQQLRRHLPAHRRRRRHPGRRVRVFDFLTARGDIGAASAQALVLALILAVLVGLYLRSSPEGGGGA